MKYCTFCNSFKPIDEWDEEYLDCGHRLCIDCQETHDDYRDCPNNTPTARDPLEKKDPWKEADRRPDPGTYGKYRTGNWRTRTR